MARAWRCAFSPPGAYNHGDTTTVIPECRSGGSGGPAMDPSERLEQLLDRREASRQQGRTLTADELCRDCPELLPELQGRIAALCRVAALVRELPSPVVTAASPEEPPAVPTGSDADSLNPATTSPPNSPPPAEP